ncbi:hypothetical protein [Altererythrobacter aquiaggeris]|uniref:hypothetical protein n=1 Tax=Aestuarierythrobacter aquiaggeris TaxID=1898396 RepID=UPI003017F2D0
MSKQLTVSAVISTFLMAAALVLAPASSPADQNLRADGAPAMASAPHFITLD